MNRWRLPRDPQHMQSCGQAHSCGIRSIPLPRIPPRGREHGLCFLLCSVIVSLTGSDNDIVPFLLVYNPVSFVNPPAPPATEVLFQRLRFADSINRIPLDILYQGIQPLEGLFVFRLP